jgi:hypothetical protein
MLQASGILLLNVPKIITVWRCKPTYIHSFSKKGSLSTNATNQVLLTSAKTSGNALCQNRTSDLIIARYYTSDTLYH